MAAAVDRPAFRFEIDDLPREGPGSIADEATKVCLDALMAKILSGVRAAFREGKDFVHGPIEQAPFGSILTRYFPVEIRLKVEGGPVTPGQCWPSDWTVYRVEALSDAERARFCAGRADWREPTRSEAADEISRGLKVRGIDGEPDERD